MRTGHSGRFARKTTGEVCSKKPLDVLFLQEGHLAITVFGPLIRDTSISTRMNTTARMLVWHSIGYSSKASRQIRSRSRANTKMDRSTCDTDLSLLDDRTFFGYTRWLSNQANSQIFNSAAALAYGEEAARHGSASARGLRILKRDAVVAWLVKCRCWHFQRGTHGRRST